MAVADATAGAATDGRFIIDELVKSPVGVITVPDHVRDDGPGIYNSLNLRDSGFRRNDAKTGKQTFYEFFMIYGVYGRKERDHGW